MCVCVREREPGPLRSGGDEHGILDVVGSGAKLDPRLGLWLSPQNLYKKEEKLALFNLHTLVLWFCLRKQLLAPPYTTGEGGELPAVGEKLLLVPGHIDPTVNMHDHWVAFREAEGRAAKAWLCISNNSIWLYDHNYVNSLW